MLIFAETFRSIFEDDWRLFRKPLFLCLYKNKKAAHTNCFFAESEGFEPSKPLWGLHTFQACAFDHSANSPERSGERGIRTPGGVTLNGFQDRRIRPLCHFSVDKSTIFSIRSKPWRKFFSTFFLF